MIKEYSLLNAFNPFEMWSNYCKGLSWHTNDYDQQTKLAGELFFGVEKKEMFQRSLFENLIVYSKLGTLNMDMFFKTMFGSVNAMHTFHGKQFSDYLEGFYKDGGISFFQNQAKSLKMMADFGEQVKAIRPQYGFHFDNGNYDLVDETKHFWVYQVYPFVDGKSQKNLVNNNLKPVLVVPPYVLGANILCFLRDLGKSYVHSFANRGIPTYVRIIKPINEHIAVLQMTQEDDCLDTARFCEIISKRHHGRKITVNGYCQGGYGSVVNWLSGKMDETVDVVMTCVTPFDGTYSKELKGFLDALPSVFNNLAYGMVIGVDGIAYASEELMAWVYKIKSIEQMAPVVTFYRDFRMISNAVNNNKPLPPTVSALNYWLRHDRAGIPAAITKISFDSYNIPITENGILPIKLFGKELNLNRFDEKGAKLVIFYAPKDDLVEPEVALAAKQYAKHVESLIGGHVKKSTSPEQTVGGPERFQMSCN